MSGEGLLLDSVVLIDHFNGHAVATDYVRGVSGAANISAITRAEVLAGFDLADADPARQLLDCFRLITIDRAVADLAAALRREHGWRLPDAIQAAAARSWGLLLVTRNTKDFPPARHDFVRVPYELG